MLLNRLEEATLKMAIERGGFFGGDEESVARSTKKGGLVETEAERTKAVLEKAGLNGMDEELHRGEGAIMPRNAGTTAKNSSHFHPDPRDSTDIPHPKNSRIDASRSWVLKRAKELADYKRSIDTATEKVLEENTENANVGDRPRVFGDEGRGVGVQWRREGGQVERGGGEWGGARSGEEGAVGKREERGRVLTICWQPTRHPNYPFMALRVKRPTLWDDCTSSEGGFVKFIGIGEKIELTAPSMFDAFSV